MATTAKSMYAAKPVPQLAALSAALLLLLVLSTAAPPAAAQSQIVTCPQCVDLTPRYRITATNFWGMPNNWPCRTSTLFAPASPNAGASRGTYNLRCRKPMPANAEDFTIAGCHLTCPTEANCLGKQCFGNLYLGANGYDEYVVRMMRCVSSPVLCTNMHAGLYANWINASVWMDGPRLNPLQPNCPEPPYNGVVNWPTRFVPQLAS